MAASTGCPASAFTTGGLLKCFLCTNMTLHCRTFLVPVQDITWSNNKINASLLVTYYILSNLEAWFSFIHAVTLEWAKLRTPVLWMGYLRRSEINAITKGGKQGSPTWKSKFLASAWNWPCYGHVFPAMWCYSEALLLECSVNVHIYERRTLYLKIWVFL